MVSKYEAFFPQAPCFATFESKKKRLNHIDRWLADQPRRIPHYSYDAPGVAAQPNALEETRLDRWLTDQARQIPRYSYDAPGVAAEPNALEETRPGNILNARRTLPRLPPDEPFEDVMERNTPNCPDPAPQQQAGHRNGTVRVRTARIHHAPTHLPGIGEVMNQGLVPTPPVARTLRVVNPDIVEDETAYRQRLIRFADETDLEANEERPREFV
ncbi:MAG: hypothetical protein Q9221_002397 [Calogaya cf. arnoldii]